AALAPARHRAIRRARRLGTGRSARRLASVLALVRRARRQARRGPARRPELARRFFELEFVPYRVGQDSGAGLFTGYYEPQRRGSRTRLGAYQTPLYGVPYDLVNVDLGLFRENLKGQRIVGKVTAGRLVPYPPRAEIESGLATAVPI